MSDRARRLAITLVCTEGSFARHGTRYEWTVESRMGIFKVRPTHRATKIALNINNL